MGTHPIFESDFDCLTDFDMSLNTRSINLDNSHVLYNDSERLNKLKYIKDFCLESQTSAKGAVNKCSKMKANNDDLKRQLEEARANSERKRTQLANIESRQRAFNEQLEKLNVLKEETDALKTKAREAKESDDENARICRLYEKVLGVELRYTTKACGVYEGYKMTPEGPKAFSLVSKEAFVRFLRGERLGVYGNVRSSRSSKDAFVQFPRDNNVRE